MFFILGVIRFTDFNILESNNIVNITKPDVNISTSGVIKTQVEKAKKQSKRSATKFILSAEKIYTGRKEEKIAGFLLCKYLSKDVLACEKGDRILLKGKIMSLPQYNRRFNYPKYMAHRKIFYQLIVKDNSDVVILNKAGFFNKIANAIRKKIMFFLENQFDGEYGAMLKAILLSEINALSKTTEDIFAKTGTMHVFSVSGLHIAMVGFIFFIIFASLRVPYKITLFLVLFFLFIYVSLVDFKAPAVRAFLMSAFIFLGYVLNRKTEIENSIAFSAFIILLIDPNQIFNLGFQLSFIAMFSIIYGSRIFRSKKGMAKKIKDALTTSFSATVGISPVIMYNFRVFTPAAIFANIVLIPITFFLVALSIFAFFLSLFSYSAASLFVIDIKFLINLLVFSMQMFYKVKSGHFYVFQPSMVYVIFFYFVAGVIVYLNVKEQEMRNVRAK